MIIIREMLACLIFLVGLVWVIESITDGFMMTQFFLGLLCLLGAHFVWPGKLRHQSDERKRFLDWLEVLIELPFEILAWLFRVLGRLLGGKGDGIDIDC
ncbi:MAG: hypothetical protein R3183_11955 [Oleiphilaceae bacterium]|nr:hypothetical protein [Oleiphilaceae bacterium]